jgi:signal peptidase I
MNTLQTSVRLPIRRPAVIFGAILLAAAFSQPHARLVLVSGDSMLPTLLSGDLLLVSRDAYRDIDPRRGDIVVARHGRELIVKRVVGVPGEQVEVYRGRLRINGMEVPEDSPLLPGELDIARGKLSPGRFALLGDNRSLSRDQIVHAVVSREQIIGRVILSSRDRPWTSRIPATPVAKE